MAKLRKGVVQCLIEDNLPRGIVQVIIPPDDMADLHGDIINHHYKIIGGSAVPAADDEIVQLGIVKDHFTFDQVIHLGLPTLRASKPDGEWLAGVHRCHIPAGPVIFRLLPPLLGLFPFCLQFIRVTVTSIGLSLAEKQFYMFTIYLSSLALIERTFIPVKPQPLHGIQYGTGLFLGGTGPVRVLNAQDEHTAVMPGKKPVKQGSSSAADVQMTRGAGCKPCPYHSTLREIVTACSAVSRLFAGSSNL